MPAKSSYSVVSWLVAMILSALATPGAQSLSEPIIILLLINGGVLFVMRLISKWEDADSMLSIYIGMASGLLVGVLTDLNFARLIVFVVYAIAVTGMRYYSKQEVYEAKVS